MVRIFFLISQADNPLNLALGGITVKAFAGQIKGPNGPHGAPGPWFAHPWARRMAVTTGVQMSHLHSVAKACFPKGVLNKWTLVRFFFPLQTAVFSSLSFRAPVSRTD